MELISNNLTCKAAISLGVFSSYGKICLQNACSDELLVSLLLFLPGCRTGFVQLVREQDWLPPICSPGIIASLYVNFLQISPYACVY